MLKKLDDKYRQSNPIHDGAMRVTSETPMCFILHAPLISAVCGIFIIHDLYPIPEALHFQAAGATERGHRAP
jgi:hypothetical protein